MSQYNYTTKRKKYKHILEKDRITIETMLLAGCKKQEIARVIGCSERTLRREIVRGSWEKLNSDYTTQVVYSFDVGQRAHEEKAKNKGPYAKINDAPNLRKYLEKKIKKEKYSPEAALNKIKEENLSFEIEITTKTVYNNIDTGEISVTRKDLLRVECWKKKRIGRTKAKNNLKGESIEKRPEIINNREEYGHWEIDLVVGRKGTKHVLLTLTERKYRQEIIRKLPNKKQKTIIKAINKLEKEYGKKFKETFKTITADNGSEFLNFTAMETSIYGGKRFKMYYAHPYSSWERGTNENANGIIRRFYPKGTNFKLVTIAKIRELEKWMNNYPRQILGGICSNSAVRKLLV